MPESKASIALTARYVFPVAGPPLVGGCVTIRGERIESVGPQPVADAVDFGNVAILPGLVNAHTHLEFSDLDAPLGKPGMPLPEWIRLVVAARRAVAADSAAAIARGLAESARCGTTTIGEIATGGWSEPVLRNAPAELVAFYETIGLAADRVAERLADAEQFVARLPAGAWGRVQRASSFSPRAGGGEYADPRHPEAVHPHTLLSRGWRGGLSPHAPYSVHPELVVGLARLASSAGLPVAMHLAETREELEFLRTGGGPFREMLVALGAWDPAAIPRGTRILEYLQVLAAAPRALVIHGNYLESDEIEYVAMHPQRMAVIYCPRTHAYFGHERYPLARLLALGASVALGTDSRASNPDLSVLAEMRHVARQFPAISPETVLCLGTIAGARALGCADEVGTLEAGKLANLAIVPLPAREAGDPHELLFDSDLPVATTYYRGVPVTDGSL